MIITSIIRIISSIVADKLFPHIAPIEKFIQQLPQGRDDDFESTLRFLREADDLEKNLRLNNAEQHGELTAEQYERLVDAAYPW